MPGESSNQTFLRLLMLMFLLAQVPAEYYSAVSRSSCCGAGSSFSEVIVSYTLMSSRLLGNLTLLVVTVRTVRFGFTLLALRLRLTITLRIALSVTFPLALAVFVTLTGVFTVANVLCVAVAVIWATGTVAIAAVTATVIVAVATRRQVAGGTARRGTRATTTR